MIETLLAVIVLGLGVVIGAVARQGKIQELQRERDFLLDCAEGVAICVMNDLPIRIFQSDSGRFFPMPTLDTEQWPDQIEVGQ